ncbi:hypothetical protein [Burkholderia ubonensis]|uniref:hypothetical protein n=1 Tax=Burkholderia ubonensis TaxID=101571 RepID=UPI0012FB8729|nr:hypothetical protein [Burkholderia ubonensis]
MSEDLQHSAGRLGSRLTPFAESTLEAFEVPGDAPEFGQLPPFADVRSTIIR